MIHLIFALGLVAQTAPSSTPPPPAIKPYEASPDVRTTKPLSFFSKKFPYRWDVLLPLDMEVDGLKLKTIFFNRRESRSGLLKGTDFGTRAQIEVTNTSKYRRIPGFAVAVFDGEDRLLGVATGGTKLGSVQPGETETFDLNFHQVLDRLPLGTSFVLSVELSN